MFLAGYLSLQPAERGLLGGEKPPKPIPEKKLHFPLDLIRWFQKDADTRKLTILHLSDAVTSFSARSEPYPERCCTIAFLMIE